MNKMFLSLYLLIFSLVLGITNPAPIRLRNNYVQNGFPNFLSHKKNKNVKITPILIIPGDAGSQLEAQLKKKTAPNWFCTKNTHGSWIRLWLSVSSFLPFAIDCWADNVLLHYNKTDGSFHNTEGVETRVPGFGETEKVEYIDPSLGSLAKYMHYFVQSMVDKGGYTRKVNIATAPFDFRVSPTQQWLSDVKSLIEKMYSENEESSVALVSHSLGGLFTSRFLNSVDQSWKDKYIHSWTPIAGVFGGSAMEFRVMASGDNQRIPTIASQQLVKQQRSFETNLWMMPDREFYSNDKVFVKTNFKNYTLKNLQEFFIDVGFEDGWLIYEQTRKLTNHLPSPGVTTNLMVSNGVDTPETVVYEKGTKHDWFHYEPSKIIYGDGDGTVNIDGLLAPQKWNQNNNNNKAVHWFYYSKKSHTELLSHDPLINDFLEKVLRK